MIEKMCERWGEKTDKTKVRHTGGWTEKVVKRNRNDYKK